MFLATSFAMIVVAQATTTNAAVGALFELVRVPPSSHRERRLTRMFEPTNNSTSFPAHERLLYRTLRAGSRRGERGLSQATCGAPQSLFSIPPGAVNVSFFSIQGGGYAATVRLEQRQTHLCLFARRFAARAHRRAPASTFSACVHITPAATAGVSSIRVAMRIHLPPLPQTAVPFELENVASAGTLTIQSMTFLVTAAPNPTTSVVVSGLTTANYLRPGLFSLMCARPRRPAGCSWAPPLRGRAGDGRANATQVAQ